MTALTFIQRSQILKVSTAASFCTGSPSYGQANVMKKLLKGSSKKRPVYSDAPMLPTPEAFSKGAFEGKKSDSSRRAAVLNKLFMRHITDLMATGEHAEVYSGLKIEINKVRVTPDYKLVQVYWLCKGNETDEVIHKILTKNAGQLRHELTQLRVIGVVPKILFCKDKTVATLAEIDERLKKADFGEDHVEVDLVSKLKTELELNSPLEPDIKEKISKIDVENADGVPEVTLPAMPQNVFGLNHADIMFRVVRGINKAKAAHRKDNTAESSFAHLVNTNPVQFPEGISQKEALKKFLHQRQLQKSKARKENKNYLPDTEYMREELEERQNNSFAELLEEKENERDYIIDYDEEDDRK